MGRHYRYLNDWLRVRLEKNGLFKSFERYFNDLKAKGFGRQKSLNLSTDKFRAVVREIKGGTSVEEALAKNSIREYAEENLPNLTTLPTKCTGDSELLEELDSFSPPSARSSGDSDGDADADDSVQWPAEWASLDLASMRDRQSTLADDCRWIYNNCPFPYGDIDPTSAPSVGALGWLMRVKASFESRDKFYKETLHRYCGKQTGVDDESNQRDAKNLRLLGKVEEASRRAQGLSEAEDAEQDAALPSGSEGDSGKSRVPQGHVEVGG